VASVQPTKNHLVLIQRKQQEPTMIQNDFTPKKWGFGRGAFRQHSPVCLMLIGSFDALPTMPILTKLPFIA
jgi:hypothetical protein